MAFTAAAAADHVQGEVIGDGQAPLTGLAAAADARPGDLTFAEKESYFDLANRSQASAILVASAPGSSDKVLIKVPNVRVAMAPLLPLFYPPAVYPAGVHSSAIVAPSAQVDSTAHV